MGSGATIVAASERGVVSGFQASAGPIPVLSVAGLLVLIALIALLSAWALATRRAFRGWGQAPPRRQPVKPSQAAQDRGKQASLSPRSWQ